MRDLSKNLLFSDLLVMYNCGVLHFPVVDLLGFANVLIALLACKPITLS